MEYISIGSICSVAYQLNKNNKRLFSYPFDWVKINKLDDATNVLEKDFKDYIESVVKINESDKFNIVEQDNFPEENLKQISYIGNV